MHDWQFALEILKRKKSINDVELERRENVERLMSIYRDRKKYCQLFHKQWWE